MNPSAQAFVPSAMLNASAPEFRPAFLSAAAVSTPIVAPAAPAEPQQPAVPARKCYTAQQLLALRCRGTHPSSSVKASGVYQYSKEFSAAHETMNMFGQNLPTSDSNSAPKNNALRQHKEGIQFLERRVIATLNKLTPEKYDKLIQDLLKEMGVELRISHAGMESMLQRVIPRIVEKAILEAHFCDMYAQLCSDLYKEIRNLDNGAIIHTEKIDENSEMTFDSSQRFQMHLLTKVQKEFQSTAAPEESAEDVEKLKHRKLSTSAFVGEIYNRGLLPASVLNKVIARLLGIKAPKLLDVECACRIITIVGKTLEADPDFAKPLKQYFAALKVIRDSPVFENQTRMQVIVENLCELRSCNWIPRHTVAKAKKLTDEEDSPASSPSATPQPAVIKQVVGGAQGVDLKSFADKLRGTPTPTPKPATAAEAVRGRGTPTILQPINDMLQRTVYITHIDVNVTEGQLMAFLTACGELNKVRLCGNPSQATQYGFFEFATVEGAQRCLAADNAVLGVHPIHCSKGRTAVHDSHPSDAQFGARGRMRACIFGIENPDRPVAASQLQRGEGSAGRRSQQSQPRTPTPPPTAQAVLAYATSSAATTPFVPPSPTKPTDGAVNSVNVQELLHEYITSYSCDQERDVAVGEALKAGVHDVRLFVKDAVYHVVQKQKLAAEREAVASMLRLCENQDVASSVPEALTSTFQELVEEEVRVDVPMLWQNVGHLLQCCAKAGVVAGKEIMRRIVSPVQNANEEWEAAAPHLQNFV